MFGGRRGVVGWVSGGWLGGGEGLQAGLVEDGWGVAGWVSWTLSFLDKQDTILVSYYPWGWSTRTCT